MTALTKLIEVVRTLFIDVFRDGKLEVADEILTDDFRFQYPFPGFSPGIEGIKEFTNVFHRSFPGFELEINDLFESDNKDGRKVAIRWTLRGTHKGDFLGNKETNKYVTFSAIGIYVPGTSPLPPHWGLPLTGDTPDNGENGNDGWKLGAGWLEMDTLGLLQQITVVKQMDEILPALRFKHSKDRS